MFADQTFYQTNEVTDYVINDLSEILCVLNVQGSLDVSLPVSRWKQSEQVVQDVFNGIRETVTGQVRRGVNFALVSLPIFT